MIKRSIKLLFLTTIFLTQLPLNLFAMGSDESLSAKYSRGLRYLDTYETYDEGLNLIEKAANDGFVKAQVKLGSIYEKSRDHDYSKALEWYKKAASQDRSAEAAEAYFNLGVMCEFGRGVEQNYSGAANYYKMAAKKGFSGAQFRLKNLFIPENIEYAYKLDVEYFGLCAQIQQRHFLAGAGLKITTNVSLDDLSANKAKLMKERKHFAGIPRVDEDSFLPSARGGGLLYQALHIQKAFSPVVLGLYEYYNNLVSQIDPNRKLTLRQISFDNIQKIAELLKNHLSGSSDDEEQHPSS